MSAKRCFVISPIGQPGTEVRVHADEVFKHIIKPAMKAVGLEPYRADHDAQAGRITDHMFESILNDQLCIALLSFQNPNVYYELAVAQSAARPVIILNLKGNPLPFDIKDHRVIEYDFLPTPIVEGVYVKQIVDMVRSLEARNWAVSVPFGTGLSPLGRLGGGEFQLHERVERYGSSEEWIKQFATAEKAIDINGITLRYWTRIPEFRSVLKARAAAGCAVRILLFHPENEALCHYMHPKIKPDRTEADEARRGFKFFADLAAEQAGVQIRMMRVGCHHQQVVRIDDMLLVSLVLFSEGTNRSPLIECRASSKLFKILIAEFNSLWEANADTAPRPVTTGDSAPRIPS